MIIGVVLGTILFIIGITLIIIILLRQKRCNCQTNGVVVDVEVTSTYDRKLRTHSKFYTPVIKYSVEGKQYEKKSWGSAEEREIGQEVLVHYNPNKRTSFYVEPELNATIIVGFTISLMGAIVFFVSLLLL